MKENETLGPDKPLHGSEPPHASISDAKLRRIISWSGVVGTAIATLSLFAFLTYHAIWGQATANTWPTAIIEKHFAAMIGTPLTVLTAYCIVSLLKVTNGPIEFEALGFKFRGASGPIILWLFCFLAIGVIFHLLWGSL